MEGHSTVGIGTGTLRRTIAAGAILCVFGVGWSACDGGPTDPELPATDRLPLQPRFPIDGLANLDALPIVFDADVDWLGSGQPSGRVTAVRIAVRNDDRDAYVAVEWSDPTLDDAFDIEAGTARFDAIELAFDTNQDGVVGPGDDIRVVYSAFGGSLYFDGHVASGEALPATIARKDFVGDGQGRMAYDATNGRYTAEFLISTQDDLAGQDGVLRATTPFTVALRDASDGSAGSMDGAFPHGLVSLQEETTTWPTLDLAPVEPIEREGVPGDLTGLIAILSEHEGPRRVYLFHPRSGSLQTVGLDESLYVARVALSHDRNLLALQASTTPQDRDSYEIFLSSLDGRTVTQLTQNDVFDGSPSWSIADGRIVYTSERDAGDDGRRVGSIVVMTRDGHELGDLSPDVVDERDPSYLEDGRIVMKTTRASPWPRYRIAAIRESGASFDILTEALGGTDHHPVARGTWIYYERFRSDTDFRTDPGARSKPWDLLTVHTGGGQGSTLVADGWANRMPVPDKTGDYVAYLRQSGHSSIELMTAVGDYLGRLVPGVTEVVQFDWK